jgi:hypothetical protein
MATGAVVLVGVTSTAGCSSLSEKTTTSPPTAAIPADPAAALAAAQSKLGSENVRFTLDAGSGIDFSGQVNAKTKNWQITGTGFVVRRIAGDLYAQASGSTLEMLPLPADAVTKVAAGSWIHSRLPVEHELTVVFNDAFPWNLAKPASQLTEITRTGSRELAGTTVINPLPRGSVSGQTTKMRVTVDLDEQGRFAKITTGPTKNEVASATVFTFTGYGAPADITAPAAGDIVDVDTPIAIYSLAPY